MYVHLYLRVCARMHGVGQAQCGTNHVRNSARGRAATPDSCVQTRQRQAKRNNPQNEKQHPIRARSNLNDRGAFAGA